MDWKTILLRILFAAVAGGAIGLNREKISQAAGLRTYMAVTEAAALTAMLGIWLKSSVGDTDAARLPAAFISGLGFLGAGAIWKDGDNTIKGLTTAAGLLASSITGIAIGAGFYFGAAVNFIASFIVIVFLNEGIKKIERIFRDQEELPICISHGDCLADAETLAGLVRAITPGIPITICQHEPFSGSHVGPGMLGLFFRGIER